VTQRVWLAIAALFLIAYTFIAPPFQTPDEVGHFWRSYSVAIGTLNPEMTWRGPSAEVPGGVRKLVGALWVTPGTPEKVGMERLRSAHEVQLEREAPRAVTFPAFYTPVPHAPQIVACFLGNSIGARPLYTFYFGRLCNAAVFLLLAFFAMRRLRVAGAVALLPMALYLAASFSSDAMTLGVAMVLTSLVLAPSESESIGKLLIASLILALCKPVYFLLPLVALVTIRKRLRFAVVLPIVLGVAISASVASRHYFAMRGDAPVDANAQMQNVLDAPFRFAGIAANDLREHGLDYLEQMVGVLGWVDVPLPAPLVWLTLLALILTAAPSTLSPLTRVVALLIVIVTMGGIALSQYLVWTPPGATTVDGMQGRYWLPLLPMLLAAVGWKREQRWAPLAFGVMAMVINCAALVILARRYY
jgi:uncharacterized membrane protein